MIDKIVMTKRTKNCMKNSRERGNRPKTHKDEKQRKKILSQTSVVLMNYFSCLSFTYLKVVGMDNTKVRAKQLIEFMDFDYQMISELLEKMYPAVFPSLPMMINAQCDYNRKFLYQSSPFSLQRELLRIRKQRQANSKEQFQVLHITKTQIKNMFLIKLLLEGVEQIDLPVLKNTKTQSIQKKVLRTVSWLLNKTSMLRTTNFEWLRTNWDWVIETVVKELTEFDRKRKSNTCFSSNFSDSTSVKKSIRKHSRDKNHSGDSSEFQMQNGVLSFGSKQNMDQTPQQQSIDLEQTENQIFHQSSNSSLISEQFCYEQVQGQIENFIEAFNYLKLSTLNPDEIEIDSEEKCQKHSQKVERQIKIRQKKKIQETNKKKKQQDQMIKKIKQKIRQQSKQSTSERKQKKPIKKKPKQLRPLYDHTAQSQSIGGSEFQVSVVQFCLGNEQRMEFEMLNESDGYFGRISDDAEQESLNDQEKSQVIEVKQKRKRTRSNKHNVSEIDKIITNILSKPSQIGTVISSQLYHTLIVTNFRVIQDHQPQKQNTFLA